MASLVTYALVQSGVKPTSASISASDTIDIGTGHNIFAVYKNTSANALTLTITPAGLTSYGVANPVVTYTLPISTGELWIPIFQAFDNGLGTGQCTVACSGTLAANQTVSVVKVNF